MPPILGCLILVLSVLPSTSFAVPLSFSFSDPIGDSTFGIDATKIRVDFDNQTGDYVMELTASSGAPFVGDFRVNISLLNPDTGFGLGVGIVNNPAFFSSTLNDFSLGIASQFVTLTGQDLVLRNWKAGDRIAVNSFPFGQPSSILGFVTEIRGLGDDFFLGDQFGVFADSPNNVTTVIGESLVVYWGFGLSSADSKIQRKDLSNGVIEDVLVGSDFTDRPRAVLVDTEQSHLYWGEESIRRSDLDGGNIVEIVPNERIISLSLDSEADRLYWSTRDGIKRSFLDGSALEQLIPLTRFVDSGYFALDSVNGHLYWTGRDALPGETTTGYIRRSDLDGNNITEIVRLSGVLSKPDAIAVDPMGHLFWQNHRALNDTPTSTLQTADLDGNNRFELINGANSNYGLAGTLIFGPDGRVYWSDFGFIGRIDADGSNRVTDLIDVDTPPGGTFVHAVYVVLPEPTSTQFLILGLGVLAGLKALNRRAGPQKNCEK